MIHQRNVLVLVAGLVLAIWAGSDEAIAQCSGGGGGRGGRPTGSPGGLNTASPYAVDPLLALRYSQNALLAQQYQRQYQQQLLAAQTQLATVRNTIAKQQRIELSQRDAQTHATRLARAEAKRAARAQRAATRLASLEPSATDYSLTSVRTD